MKKLIITLLLGVIFTTNIFSSAIFFQNSYKIEEANTWGQEQMCHLVFGHFDKENMAILIIVDNKSNTILFPYKELPRMIKAFDKYEEWEEIAMENKVKVDKAIPDSDFGPFHAVWETSIKKDQTTKDAGFTFEIDSINTRTHYLKLKTKKTSSLNNMFIELEARSILIPAEEVSMIKKALSKSNRERIIKVHEEEEKEKDELFN